MTNTLVFRNHKRALTSSVLAGQTIAQASVWLRSKSLELMGTETTIAQREYADLPACAPLAGGTFAPVAAETGQIARWYQDARSLLDDMRTPGSPM